ncbi:MAG: alpha/beta hydrolase family protein [Polyangiales bacterium]
MRSTGLLLLVLAAACSSKGDDPNGFTPASDAFTARFELPSSGKPSFLQVPFPSDLQLAADGTVSLDVDGVQRLVPSPNGAKYIVESLARTRGFGVYGGVVFELTGGAPDASKLPTGKTGDCTTKDSPIVFFDLDAGAPVECQAGWNDDTKLNRNIETTPVLVVRTARGVVLPEKHRIAVLLTSAITSGSSALAASAQFASIRDGQRDATSKPYGDAIDAVVAKVGVDKAKVVSAAVYTTGPVTEEFRAARELARAGAIPTLKWGADDVAPVQPAKFAAGTLPDGWTATLDDLLGTPNKLPDGSDDPDRGGDNPGTAHDGIGAIGTAVIDAPNFLIDLPAGYGDPSHGTFFHDGAGKLAINPAKPTGKVWITFFVPKAAAPASGYPAVVYQHGLGGQRGDAFQMANTLCKKGWVTVAIEPVLQGTRGASANARGDKKSDYKRSTSKYDGPDGFTDHNSEGANEAPNDLFGNLFRLSSLRDQFRQSVIDHTTLLRLLSSSPTLDALAIGGVAPKIVGTKVAYSGDSLGGILGSLLAGIEPDHKAYVLNVPGGALLTELATNSPNIYSLLNGSAALNFGFLNAQMPPWHPMVNLMQHVIDGGDPIAVASTTTKPVPIAGSTPKPRNLLLIEALADEVVSNHGTEALARGMGIPVAKPHGPLLANLAEVDGAAAKDVPSMGATGVLVQAYPAQHGSDLYGKSGGRHYDKNRPNFGDPSTEVFPTLAKDLTFQNPYLDLQTMVTAYLTDALDGKTPVVNWSKMPAPIE